MYSDQILGYPDVSACYESECEIKNKHRRCGFGLFSMLFLFILLFLFNPNSAHADYWKDYSAGTNGITYFYSTAKYTEYSMGDTGVISQEKTGVIIERIQGTIDKQTGYLLVPDTINNKTVIGLRITTEDALDSSIKGIEFRASATKLKEVVIENQKSLSVEFNSLKTNSNLVSIRIVSSELDTLFFSGGRYPALREMEIEQSRVSILTGRAELFYGIPYMKSITCKDSEISGLEKILEISEELQSLDCSSCNLPSLDVSKNAKLETLNCSNNQLTSLDLSANTELVSLDCSSNNLSSLDLSNNTKLQNLNVSSNALTALDVSPCPNLQSLKCSNNKLSSLDISSNPELVFLDCSKNELTALDISQNAKLEGLVCSGNKIEDTSTLREWIKNHPTYSNGDEVIKNELFAEGEDPGTEPENPNPDNPGLDDPNKDPSNPGNTGSDQPTTPSNPSGPGTPSNPSEPSGPSGSTTVTPSPSNPDPSLLSSIKTITGKWSHNSKGWWFTCTDGSYARGLNRIGSKIYYFDSKAWMKTGWQKINNNWYYFASSGALKTGWQKVKGKWYYLDPSTGRMKTGFFKVKNVTYYANSSGVMKTGWQKISNSWYYFASSGAMKTDWAKTGGKWYYLNSEGKMQTGKQVISGKTYFLNSSGAMRTGWIKDGTIWRYANKSGAMQTSKWIGNYYVDAEGTMLTNQWVKTNGKEYYVNKAGKWTGAKR